MIASVDTADALAQASAAARRAGQVVVAMARDHSFEVSEKHGVELVTTADLRSETLIRDHLLSCFPEHRFLGEESGEEDSDFAGPWWVVDPIDGTANYAHGHPHFSISIGLLLDGEPLVGVVYAPLLDELYAAVRGQGATCNERPIHVSQTTELRRALVSTGFPHDRSAVEPAVERVRRLVTTCQDVRRAGSPAIDICWVAAGHLDAHSESLRPWDVAAAGLIATEAGALRGNLEPPPPGVPPMLWGSGFVVATPAIFNPLVGLLRE